MDTLIGLDKEAEDDLRSKQKQEFQMWQTWKNGGQKKRDLRPLVRSFKPLVAHQANVYAGRVRDIPPAAIRAEFTNHFVQALDSYDPNRGAALGTHIRHQLKKARRFVTTYQNVGRIPENRIYKIRELQDAESRLDDEFGRSPTQLELADAMKVSPKTVDYLQREIRRAVPTGQFESDPSTFVPSEQKANLRLLRYDLNPDEQQVYEHLYGLGGKPRLGPGAIARKLNMSAPKVSRIKRSIADKYAKYTK
jgi:RNA polymerase nonessential primary-like sigma factor